LDVTSDTSGLLVPRMTEAQRLPISKPATGLRVIQTDGVTGFYYNAGTPSAPTWLSRSTYTLQQSINTNGKWISNHRSDNGLQVNTFGVGIGTKIDNARLAIRQRTLSSFLTSYLDHGGNLK
jgi:hypothetical protein